MAFDTRLALGDQALQERADGGGVEAGGGLGVGAGEAAVGVEGGYQRFEGITAAARGGRIRGFTTAARRRGGGWREDFTAAARRRGGSRGGDGGR